MSGELIYLDNAATTPLDPAVLAGLGQHLEQTFANPGSAHPAGRAANAVLEAARSSIAQAIGAAPEQWVWTSGGTEAITLAIHGLAGTTPGSIVISAVEHAAVHTAAAAVAERGDEVRVAPVHRDGSIDLEALGPLLDERTRIVATMLANNEVGAINDLAAIGALVRRRAPRARWVVDAVQGFGKIDLDVGQIGCDALIAAAHKVHGPKGIGGLYLRQPEVLRPMIPGAGQESGLRGGTPNAPLAWGFAEALRLQIADPRCGHMTMLSHRLLGGLQASIEGVELIGPPVGPLRLPNVLSVLVRGVPSGPLVNALAEAGLCVSAGSACTAAQKGTSKVFIAIGRTGAEGAFLRFSFGRQSSEAEVDGAVERMVTAVAMLRDVYG
jgi:cysteine desulfurase